MLVGEWIIENIENNLVSTDKGLEKLWYFWRVEYYLVIKNDTEV